MALVHEFEKSGNWLFKRRSWLPVIIVIAGIAVMYFGNHINIQFDFKYEMIFLGVSLAGQGIRVLTVGFTPKNTSGRNTTKGQLAEELNVTGIYSLIRHPLYLGNFLMWFGPALFLRSIWFDVVFVLLYWLYYERIMFAEEQFLRKKFGEIYDKWSENVPSIIPRSIKKYISASLPFSFRNVLMREYNSFVNIFIIFTLLDLFRNYFLTGRIFMTKIWLWLFVVSVLIWIVIRTIHKNTRWLKVEGR